MSALQRARDAAALMANGLALVLIVWWLVDVDGDGEARCWRVAALVCRELAAEFGAFGIYAERRYWEVVQR